MRWGGEEDGLWDTEVQLEEGDNGDDGLRFAGSGWLGRGGEERSACDEGEREEQTHPLDQAQSLAHCHRYSFGLTGVEAKDRVARHAHRVVPLMPLDPRVDELIVGEEAGRVELELVVRPSRHRKDR